MKKNERQGFNARTLLVCAGGAAVSFASSHVAAQAYPSKSVRVIVAFAPGGGADIVARLTSQKLSERLGQQFVVDNRGGASAIIGTELAARAAPDGYTILVGQTGPNAQNPALFDKLPYDAIKDFAAITQATSYPYVVALHPSVPARTIKELIALAKARPGEIAYGSPGPGSTAHVAIELFSRSANIKMTHVPYRGSGPTVMATVAGQLSMIFGDAAATTPLAFSGKLRAIAVTGNTRSPRLPEVPTVAEGGLPGFSATAWHGFFAPAATPRDIVNKLSSEIAAALKPAELRERLAQDGIEIVGSTPDEFSAFVRQENDKWGKVIRAAGIKLE